VCLCGLFCLVLPSVCKFCARLAPFEIRKTLPDSAEFQCLSLILFLLKARRGRTSCRICTHLCARTHVEHHFFNRLYIREYTKPRCTCPSSSAVLLTGVFSRKPVELCVCTTVWSWSLRLKVHVMIKVM